jgi:hypothetical protein
MSEPAPNIKAPTTDVPFLDTEAIAEPGAVGMVPEENSGPPLAEMAHETPAAPGPCADCAKYARLGYVAGVVIGVSAGAVVAYVILRNRMNPVEA